MKTVLYKPKANGLKTLEYFRVPSLPPSSQVLVNSTAILEPNGATYLSLHATDSVMFYWYQFHAILRGKFSRRAIQAWLNANTEGKCQIDERENKITKT